MLRRRCSTADAPPPARPRVPAAVISMGMESSRRSAVDRAPRDIGPKKPRLSDETADRDRFFNAAADLPPPPRDPRRGQLLNRDRGEKEEPAKGPGSLQQHRQLVGQYKTAIAELTSNSKPIITNLTIIAGENLHAAKGISATICNHILEVSNEQKLPSLYLLDSIVKNIKGDYIKYFAAKLPEVFCKAYRQVDSPIHPSMRHLFGTWKTVFLPHTLQIIEKELGFSSTTNGSSGAATSKPESQSAQRQPHIIHVNPKYLETRQRLQQLSKKTNDTNNDGTDGVGGADKYDDVAVAGNAKQWARSLNKNVHRQTEQVNDPLNEKQGYRDMRDQDSFPELSGKPLELEVGRVTEKVKERDVLGKPYYGSIGDVSEVKSNRRNDFDVNQAHGTSQSVGAADTDRQRPSTHLNTNKSNRPISSNWENSEEFMWDDKSLRLRESGGTNSIRKGGWNGEDASKPASSQRGRWIAEHLDSPWNKLDSLSQFRKTPEEEETPPSFSPIEEGLPQPRGQQDTGLTIELVTPAAGFSVGQAASGYHPSSLWPPRGPPHMVGNFMHVSSRISGPPEGPIISHAGVFLARPELPSHAILPSRDPFPGSVGTFGQSKQHLRPLSPSAQSPPSSVSIQQKPHNLSDHGSLKSRSFSQMGQTPVQLPGHLNRASHVPAMQDTYPGVPQGHSEWSHALPSSPSSHLQISSASSVSLTQMRHHLPFPQLSQPDLAHQTPAPQLPLLTEKAQAIPLETHITQGYSATSHSNNHFDVPGKPSTSDLLAAIMKSGLLPSNPASGLLHGQIVQPPLPSGPPPIQTLTSSTPLMIPSSLPFVVPHGRAPAPVPSHSRPILPPLPPGPPPTSSQIVTTLISSNTGSSPPNPYSGLLNSLLAKGIISSSAPELPMSTVVPAEMPNKLLNETSSSVSSVSTLGPSTSTNSDNPPTKEQNISEPCAPSPVTTTKLDDLIGFDFKPEIIREFCPLVINSLFDDLKHQCSRCGLRFKNCEQLDSHMDWHAAKESRISNFERVSRSWYADKSNWASGNVVTLTVVTAAFLEELVPSQEKCEEPMVPADESQSICALCGEPFEDFYSDERDEWMYKGTVYLSSAIRQVGIGGTDESMESGLIVHAKCVSS